MADSAEIQAQRLEDVGKNINLLILEKIEEQELYENHEVNEWSVMQIIGHLTEMIPHWLNAINRLILSSEENVIFGREYDDLDRINGVNHGQSEHPNNMSLSLGNQIKWAADEIRNMSEQERNMIGRHIKFGEMTVAALIELLIVDHAEEHLEQIRVLIKKN